MPKHKLDPQCMAKFLVIMVWGEGNLKPDGLWLEKFKEFAPLSIFFYAPTLWMASIEILSRAAHLI